LGAIGSAALANQLQRSAGQQLDSAGYALDILKSELSAAMQFGHPEPVAVAALPPARPLRATQKRQPLAA